MSDLIDEFFANDFDEHVRAVLEHELGKERLANLTFNLYNVHIDHERQRVRIQDDLDPGRLAEITVTQFTALMNQHRET